MISAKFGRYLEVPLAPVLKKIPFHPNAITVAGFVVTLCAAVALAFHAVLGGVLLLLGGAFDSIDGMVARTNGKASSFGAYLDSVLDRYSDAFLFFGIAYYLRNDLTGVFLSMGSLIGSLAVSYARARAEGLGVECKVGIMERPERIILIAMGALTGYLVPMLLVMFVLTNVTVVQRMLHTRKQLMLRG